MSKPQHTPGPWHCPKGSTRVRALDGTLIADTVSAANARLVVAAPAMYDLLDNLSSANFLQTYTKANELLKQIDGAQS